MTHPPGAIPHPAVAAPLRLAHPLESLGRAVWLFVALLASANPKGVVLCTRASLATTLVVSVPEIEAWLARLVDAKLVILQPPNSSDTVALKIASWFGPSSLPWGNPVENRMHGSGSVEDVPVYGHGSARAIALGDKSPGDRGAGEGELRREVRSILPDANPEEIDRIVGHYPQAVLRRAIDRVGKANRIKKSKAALFRFLLGKFSQEIDVNDP